MKLKQNLFVVALHILLLAGFSLLQGCAGGPCFVDCLNWPYNVPTEGTSIVPEQGYSEPDSMLLPPDTFPEGPEIMITPVDVTPERPVVTGPDQFYTVRKGDTLSGIASMYGTTWKKLSAYNGLDNAHRIYPGQELRIDGSLSSAAPVSRSSAPGSTAAPSSSGFSKGPIPQGGSYVIQKGDTLSGIAKRCGLSVAELKAANALTSNVIVAGKSLSIPKTGEVSTPVPVVEPESVPAPVSDPALGIDAAIDPAPIADIAPLAPASAPVYEHVLYPGETLEDVASQFGSTKEEIMLLNNLASPDDIKPGTKLLIPIPE